MNKCKIFSIIAFFSIGSVAFGAKTHSDNGGRKAMPVWGNILSNAEAWHLVNYIQLMDKISTADNEDSLNHGDSADESHGS